jgi:TolB-like protein
VGFALGSARDLESVRVRVGVRVKVGFRVKVGVRVRVRVRIISGHDHSNLWPKLLLYSLF